MGKWRNKGEAPAPEAPRRNAKKKANQEMQAFNTRLFDPVNSTIEHADKLELQSLANAARGGDPQAVQAYQDKLWNSGLTQEEKLALGEMFKVKNPKRGRGGRIKASPQDVPKEIDPNKAAYQGPGRGIAYNDDWWNDPKIINESGQPQLPSKPKQPSAKERMRERYGMNGPASRGY